MGNVLLIDDDWNAIRVINRALSARGHVVQVERDAASAMQRIRRTMPGVIVLDKGMRVPGGADMCRMLKTDRLSASVPVVLMTPDPIEFGDVGVDGGPDAFVSCPFLADTLVRAVERALR